MIYMLTYWPSMTRKRKYSVEQGIAKAQPVSTWKGEADRLAKEWSK